jgi:hypothetical protein
MVIKYIDIDKYESGTSIFNIAKKFELQDVFVDWINETYSLTEQEELFDIKNYVFYNEDSKLLGDFLEYTKIDFNIYYGDTYKDDLFRVRRI